MTEEWSNVEADKGCKFSCGLCVDTRVICADGLKAKEIGTNSLIHNPAAPWRSEPKNLEEYQKQKEGMK